jgi:hypothetical protein
VINEDFDQALRTVEDLLGDGAKVIPWAYLPQPPTLEVSLDFQQVDCVDCVLPPDVLASTIVDVIRDETGLNDLKVIVRDPRIPADVAHPCIPCDSSPNNVVSMEQQ